jgi:hypothetical protein
MVASSGVLPFYDEGSASKFQTPEELYPQICSIRALPDSGFLGERGGFVCHRTAPLHPWYSDLGVSESSGWRCQVKV